MGAVEIESPADLRDWLEGAGDGEVIASRVRGVMNGERPEPDETGLERVANNSFAERLVPRGHWQAGDPWYDLIALSRESDDGRAVVSARRLLEWAAAADGFGERF